MSPPAREVPSTSTSTHRRRSSRTLGRDALSTEIVDLTTPPSSPEPGGSKRPIRTYGTRRASKDSAPSLLLTPQAGSLSKASRFAGGLEASASSPGVSGATQLVGNEAVGDGVSGTPITRKGKEKAAAPLSIEQARPLSAHKRRRSNPLLNDEAVNSAAAHSTLPTRPASSKQPEKRVMPNRIRRAAGGGAEGIRDLEEMVLDWLERYGAPSDDPPDSLAIYLTSLPLAFVDPAPTYVEPMQHVQAVTATPLREAGAGEINPLKPLASPRIAAAQAKLEQAERIETPSWSMVKPGEDDEWEARGELEQMAAARQAGLQSPVKRLRKALPDDPIEEMSDSHYTFLHKKYEALERRQRIREKEKLQFERYKLKSRIELLRNMGTHAWVSVVMTVLSRHPDTADGATWRKGKERVRREGGIEWLRRILIKEGLEVLQRQKMANGEFSRNSTPMSRATTPPEDVEVSEAAEESRVVDRRLAALRDPSSGKPGKRGRRASSPTARKRKSHSMHSINRHVQSVPRPRQRRRSSVGSPTQNQAAPRRLQPSSGADETPRRGRGRPRKDSVSPLQQRRPPAAALPSVQQSKLTPVKSTTLRTSKRSSAKEHVELPAPTRRPRGSLKSLAPPQPPGGGLEFWSHGDDKLGIASISSSTILGTDVSSPKRLQEVTKEDVLEMREVEAAVVI